MGVIFTCVATWLAIGGPGTTACVAAEIFTSIPLSQQSLLVYTSDMPFTSRFREEDDAVSELELPSSHMPPIEPLFDESLNYSFNTATHQTNEIHATPVGAVGAFDASGTRLSSPDSNLPSLYATAPSASTKSSDRLFTSRSSSATATPSSTGAVGTPESIQSLEGPTPQTGGSRKGKERAVDNGNEPDVAALATLHSPNAPPANLISPYDGASAANVDAHPTTPDATPTQGDFSQSTFASVHPAMQPDVPAAYDASWPSGESSMLEGLVPQSAGVPSQVLSTGYDQTSFGAAGCDLQYFQVNQQQADPHAEIGRGFVENNHMAAHNASFGANYGATYAVPDPNPVGVSGHRYNASLQQFPDNYQYNNMNNGFAASHARAEPQNSNNSYANVAPATYNAMGGHGHAGYPSSAGGRSGAHDVHYAPLQPAVPAGSSVGHMQRHELYAAAQYGHEGAGASYVQMPPHVSNMDPQRSSQLYTLTAGQEQYRQAAQYNINMGLQGSSRVVPCIYSAVPPQWSEAASYASSVGLQQPPQTASCMPNVSPQQLWQAGAYNAEISSRQVRQSSNAALSWQGSVPVPGSSHPVETGAGNAHPRNHRVQPRSYHSPTESTLPVHTNQDFTRTSDNNSVPPVLVETGVGDVYPRAHRVQPQSYRQLSDSTPPGRTNQHLAPTSDNNTAPPVSARQNLRQRYPGRRQASSNVAGANPGFQQPQGAASSGQLFPLANILGVAAPQPAREPSSGPQRPQRSTTAARLEATAQPAALSPTSSEASSSASSGASNSGPVIECPIPGCGASVVAKRCKMGTHLKEFHPECETDDGKFQCIFDPPVSTKCFLPFASKNTLAMHYLDLHREAPECRFCGTPLRRINEKWAMDRHNCPARDERRK
ncbi:hypothetical protein DENSPDRAFT_875778 [Dentipellis sp. KUC8613]|nr:hypothetical protein DENSPDRAFT_875778 [Dentipellis sp. KUC8613]